MFTLNSPLCFLLNRYGKTAEKLLKTALLDFYDDSVLNSAKHQLISDIGNIVSVNERPPVPERREGEQRAMRIVDDLFFLLTFLDTNKLTDKLPIYVTDNPDCVPSTRIYESDLSVLMSMLAKIELKLVNHEAILAGIGKELHAVQVRTQVGPQVGPLVGTQVGAAGPPSGFVMNAGRVTQPNGVLYNRPPAGPFIPLARQPVINQPPAPVLTAVPRHVISANIETVTMQRGYNQPVRPLKPQPPPQPPRIDEAGRSVQSQSSPPAPIRDAEQNENNTNSNCVWSNEIATSSPFFHRNRFEPLQFSDDEAARSESDAPFTDVISARQRRIRRREESSLATAAQPRASAGRQLVVNVVLGDGCSLDLRNCLEVKYLRQRNLTSSFRE